MYARMKQFVICFLQAAAGPAIGILLFIIYLSLNSCSTTLYHPNGKPKFRTYGDSASIAYQDKTTKLQVTDLNHSAPTRATGSVVGTTMTGAAAMGIGGVR
jgi:hypothetical protein